MTTVPPDRPDPVRAVPTVSAARPRPTAYVGDTLLVRGLPGGAREDLLTRLGGFGCWSGTWFAAPVLAGELGWTP